MKVEKIHHVTIMVHDIEAARKRLGDLFELEFTPAHPVPGADSINCSSPIGVVLGAPLTPDGVTAKGLEKRGEGLSVLALQVTNIDKAIKEMEANKVRCVARQSAKGALFHPRDLYGVMIDLIEV